MMECGWDLIKRIFAEFMAAALYIFLGCFAAFYVENTESFIMGVVFGGSMVYILQAFENISGGHASPIVTIGGIIMRKTPWDEGLLYILMQFLGSFFGFGIAYFLKPRPGPYFEIQKLYCCVYRRNDISIIGAIIVELLGSILYMIVWCFYWTIEDENIKISMPFYIGVALSGILVPTGLFTGASMNPFRAIPPAIFAMEFEDIWLWVAMPFLGGVIPPICFFLWGKFAGKKEEAA